MIILTRHIRFFKDEMKIQDNSLRKVQEISNEELNMKFIVHEEEMMLNDFKLPKIIHIM